MLRMQQRIHEPPQSTVWDDLYPTMLAHINNGAQYVAAVQVCKRWNALLTTRYKEFVKPLKYLCELIAARESNGAPDTISGIWFYIAQNPNLTYKLYCEYEQWLRPYLNMIVQYTRDVAAFEPAFERYCADKMVSARGTARDPAAPFSRICDSDRDHACDRAHPHDSVPQQFIQKMAANKWLPEHLICKWMTTADWHIPAQVQLDVARQTILRCNKRLTLHALNAMQFTLSSLVKYQSSIDTSSSSSSESDDSDDRDDTDTLAHAQQKTQTRPKWCKLRIAPTHMHWALYCELNAAADIADLLAVSALITVPQFLDPRAPMWFADTPLEHIELHKLYKYGAFWRRNANITADYLRAKVAENKKLFAARLDANACIGAYALSFKWESLACNIHVTAELAQAVCELIPICADNRLYLHDVLYNIYAHWPVAALAVVDEALHGVLDPELARELIRGRENGRPINPYKISTRNPHCGVREIDAYVNQPYELTDLAGHVK